MKESRTREPDFAVEQDAGEQEPRPPARVAVGKRQRTDRLAARIQRDAITRGLRPGAAVEVRAAAASSGRPLPAPLRGELERALGRDLGGVRVHDDAAAAAAAEALQARAFAVGQEIFFGAGRFDPESPAGRRLIAHEVAHTAQTPAAGQLPHDDGELDVSQPGEPREREADEFADAFAHAPAGAGPAAAPAPPAHAEAPAGRIQRDGERCEDTPEGRVREACTSAGLDVSDADVQTLARTYPDGITIQSTQLVALASGAGSISAVRVNGYRILGRAPSSGMTTYFLHVGHGRGIVLQSTGGESVMLDAGDARGQGLAAEGLAALRSAGLVTAPGQIRISHGHADHFNNIDEILRQAGMQGTSIQLASQIFRNAVAQGTWRAAGISGDAGRRIVEINVVGDGVHVQREIIGNMEIVDFRLTRAAQTAADAQTPQQFRSAQNSVAPVTIVRDRRTGQTQFFTADITPRALNEIIDIVGESAMAQLMGAGGGTLARAEVSHHGGTVSGSGAAVATLRALRLQLEASRGEVELVVQTDPNFVNRATAHVRVLRLIGAEVTEIHGPSGAEAGTPATRRGAAGHDTVEINQGRIVAVNQMVQQSQSDLRDAYRARGELQRLLAEIEPMEAAFSGAGASEQASSVRQLRTAVEAMMRPIEGRINDFWTAAEGAARAEGGLNTGMDLSGPTAARANLRTAVAAERNVEQVRRSIETHRAMMGHAEALSGNAIEMLRSFHEGNFARVHELRPEQNRLLQEAARELGAREVFEHVRGAWQLQRVRGYTERASQLLAMHRVAHARAVAGQSLARQMQLTRLVNQASHGQLPRTSGPMPARTRAGAGFMAAIEALRILLEVAEAVQAAQQAEEQRQQNRIARGRNMVQWWLQRGANPELALLDGDDNQVTMGQEDIWRALRGEEVAGVPENARVVVTEVSIQDRLRAAAQLAIAADDLDDWGRLVEDGRYDRHEQGWQPFVRHEGRWKTLTYTLSARAYQASFDQSVHDTIERLYDRLRQRTQARLDERNAGHDQQTIHDTAWVFGHDRNAFVFNQAGRLTVINFGATQPRLVVVNREFRPGRALMRAADAATYETLRQYFWNTGRMVGIGDGWHQTEVVPNTGGLCMVDTDNLRPAPAAAGGGAGH